MTISDAAPYVRGPRGYRYHRNTPDPEDPVPAAACGAFTRTDVTTLTVYDRRFGVACSRCFPPTASRPTVPERY